MPRTLLYALLVALLSLAACGSDDPKDLNAEILDCVFEVSASGGGLKTAQASVVFLAGGGAILSVPPYEANLYVEEGPGQALVIRFEIFGPEEFWFETRGDTDPSAGPGTRRAWGSAGRSGDHLSWECVGP